MMWTKLMLLFLPRFQIPKYIPNSMLPSPTSCSILALLKGVLRTISAKVLSQVLPPHTIIKENGYFDYACPDNGRTIQKRVNIFDNSHVVPYPRELVVKFDCHINLEVCCSIKAVLQGSRSCHCSNRRS